MRVFIMSMDGPALVEVANGCFRVEAGYEGLQLSYYQQNSCQHRIAAADNREQLNILLRLITEWLMGLNYADQIPFWLIPIEKLIETADRLYREGKEVHHP